MEQKAKSRFDEMARQWDSNPQRVALAKAVGQAIIKTIPLSCQSKVLDYGAGTGLLTLCLQPNAGHILALDSSKGMLDVLAGKLAEAKITNVQTRQCDLVQQALSETDFDVVTSSMTLHHVRDVPALLGKLTCLLKPGGWLAVADLDSEDGSFHGPSNDVFHHGFAWETIAQWLREAGLARVQVTRAHRMIKTNSQGENGAYNIFLATGIKA